MHTKALQRLVGGIQLMARVVATIVFLWRATTSLAADGAMATSQDQDVTSALTTIAHGPVSDRHAAVRRLSELGTPEARKVLLDVALGRYGRGSQTWAARCFVKVMEQPGEARALLTATNSEIATIGLLALRGEAIDRELLADLKRFLQSASVHVRTGCGQIIKAAPTSELPDELVRAVLESIRTAHLIDRADEPMRAANEFISVRTEVGWVYETLISALSQSPSIELKLLQDLTPSESGLLRDCTLIARAQRGDRTLTGELRRIARTSPNSGVRWASLQPFATLGTIQDVPFLEELAQTDPLAVALTEAQRQAAADSLAIGIPTPVPEVYYPIRSHAERLIRQIKSRADKVP